MESKFLLYCLLLLLAAAATATLARQNKSLWLFFAVLASSLFIDFLFECILICSNGQEEPYYLYFLYGPIYYALFAGYFYNNLPGKGARRYIIYSIMFYTIGIIVSYRLHNSVWLEINVAGMLLIPLCLISLYTLNIKDRSPLYSRPLFWISMATFVFYTSEFVVLGLKSYLSIYDDARAKALSVLLNYINNYIYYTVVTIGMLLCSDPIQKSSRP